jgi:hypothetical protein
MLSGQAGAIGDTEKPVVEKAQAWLALIDAGQYAPSWQDASTYFRGAIDEKKWADTLTAVRKPLGAMQSRTVATAKHHTDLPGAPDGEYVLMTFDTSFANKKAAVETVTFVKEKDGTWRAVGYFIK